jgi:CheY-like chemotaxis protein
MSDRPRRILLVDDDADLRQSLAEALENEGYLVAQAANGAEAMETLRQPERPAVILLDLLMPVMNGWQFCELKQRDPDTAHIPVLAMSAAVSKDPTSPYYINVDDFIAKPVELDALLSKVNRLAAREGPG